MNACQWIPSSGYREFFHDKNPLQPILEWLFASSNVEAMNLNDTSILGSTGSIHFR